ncbi:MAG: bifunctional folylpolyglutamate synthase/dihydrofolate synthase [Microcella sp.]|uniref:bifunctional folylpolyglutamate synthase/dihydrofolate synthase n=1 Tax=Microcella sp. TaxID=1913979 RepID=UPI0024C89973|nr:folylpolyglutamate synthase/dihydrofolate synthase family protein [Microcella sp.]UYN84614.1 MAG: bifunctional folylpolyglutamate synthase/dihydrofolate synthase [Microcella sp.]
MTPDRSADDRAAAEAVHAELLARIGEANPQPRLEATRRAAELLGDPHRSFAIVHITGTNGKTSTARMIESILRAYGLRTGLLTSPHLTRLNERIVIDGEPISDRMLADTWADIAPYLLMVDAELTANGEAPLSNFEALTALSFAAFADAPVDVAVLEVGMGGEWDSTNIADGDVAVLTPIALDHERFLGSTVGEIARTKAGIIKPAATVVTAIQQPEAMQELTAAAEHNEAAVVCEGIGFALVDARLAVGGQLIDVRGRAGEYREVFLPLFGVHQAQNAAVAIAAVESFLGDGTQPLADDVLAEGLGSVTSPGRLQLIGTEPSVLIDAAHNPHGAEALARALLTSFAFDSITAIVGVLDDKDARGIIEALDPVVDRFIVSSSATARSIDGDELADVVAAVASHDRVSVEPSLAAAIDAARAEAGPNDAVLITGSVTMAGQALLIAREQNWVL